MMNSLVKSLIQHESIKTTLPKAKDLRSIAEKYITKAKSQSLHTRRLLTARLQTKDNSIVRKLLDVGSRYIDRPGGYTRITKIGYRQGDAAPMAVISLV